MIAVALQAFGLILFAADFLLASIAIPALVVGGWTFLMCLVAGTEPAIAAAYAFQVGRIGAVIGLTSVPVMGGACLISRGGLLDVLTVGAFGGICVSSLATAAMTLHSARFVGVGLAADYVFMALAGGVPAGCLAAWVTRGYVLRARRRLGRWAARSEARVTAPEVESTA